MNSENRLEHKAYKVQLLLPTLILSSFLEFTGTVLLSTLLVDIASSLKVPIGTASQLALVCSFLFLIMGLVMSALSIRFRHKSLFLLGVAIISIGSLVFFLAPNLATALLSQLLMGTGSVIHAIMTFSLVGDLLPLEKRGWAIGLIISTQFLAFAFFAPLSGFIGGIAGWRSVLLFFIFPLSITCFVLGLIVIPSKSHQDPSPPISEYSKAFKKIFSNKSAVGCLAGTTLLLILDAITFYAVSFYRITFSLPPIMGGMFSSAAAVGGIFGAIGGGKLINSWGRKPLAITAAFIAGVLTIAFTFIPDIRVSVAFWELSAFSVAVAGTSLTSLTLEQVPEFRASMMSISRAFAGLGAVLSFTIGGLVLNLSANNFQLLMTIIGASGVTLAIVLLLFSRDTPKKLQHTKNSVH